MIIICKYCGQYTCPSSCPSFDGNVAGLGARKGACARCETNVYDGEGYFEKNGKILCRDCAEELVSTELLDFLDCENLNDFFDLLW